MAEWFNYVAKRIIKKKLNKENKYTYYYVDIDIERADGQKNDSEPKIFFYKCLYLTR